MHKGDHMKHILFVCTGNTCRSSMAEGIFKAVVGKDDKLRGKYTVSSAGVSAYPGDSASGHSIKVLKDEWDIDISTHRSSPMNAEAVRGSDLILTMTRSHKDAVLSQFPEAAHKTYTLKEFASEQAPDRQIQDYNYMLDILDPYGMPLHIYRKCAYEIKDSVDKLTLKFLKMG